MTDREAIKIAFDAFEDLKAFATDSGAMPENWDAYYPKQYDALEVLRRVLALPEQIITLISPDQYERLCGACGACLGKPWIGLTDEEILDLWIANHKDTGATDAFARAIEAALRGKNVS
jgi:hypothetical protein